jgi:hypothetical protein
MFFLRILKGLVHPTPTPHTVKFISWRKQTKVHTYTDLKKQNNTGGEDHETKKKAII